MQPTKIQQLRVLIVEDDRHMRTLIRNMLISLGVDDVADAAEGSAAFEEMSAFRPNLILCDLKMAPMGGLEFTKQLRADRENPYRLVPVIMVTAYAEIDTVAGARDAGATEFMAKPVSAAALTKRIERVLKDPRPFVESPRFTGPDRRRGKNDAFGGEDRRETPPAYIPGTGASPPDGA